MRLVGRQSALSPQPLMAERIKPMYIGSTDNASTHIVKSSNSRCRLPCHTRTRATNSTVKMTPQTISISWISADCSNPGSVPRQSVIDEPRMSIMIATKSTKAQLDEYGSLSRLDAHVPEWVEP
eukprot:scaffold20900_cov64-Phaeocystis_antarctica.AAC.4